MSASKIAKVPPFKLKLLCGEWFDVLKKPRYHNLFDVLTISTHVAYLCADKRLNQLLRPRAAVALETAKFLVEVRGEQRKDYAQKLHACAMALGWESREADADGHVDGIANACLW